MADDPRERPRPRSGPAPAGGPGRRPGRPRPTGTAPPRRRPHGRGTRRRPLRWWSVPIAVVVALLAAELVARTIGPDLPRVAGTDEESLLKAGDIDARAGERTDIVFIGASETAAGLVAATVDEATTSFTGAYNAALRGGSPATNEAWSRRVVLPRLHPEVAVVGLLPWSLAVLEGKGAEFQQSSDVAYAAAFDEVDPGRLGAIEQDLDDHVALLRYRSGLREPTTVIDGVRAWWTGRAKPLDANVDPAVLRASITPAGETLDYRERPEVQLPDADLGSRLGLVGRGRFDLDDLRDLLRSLRDEGVVPVLALAPVDRTLLTASGLDLAAIDAVADRVVALGEQLDVPVLDRFRSDYGSDRFHDKEHLDEAGATAWSGEVGAWLDDLCAADRLGGACPSG